MSAEGSEPPTRREPIRSDRPDGRFRSTAGVVHHRLKSLKPELSFDPAFDPKQFTEWQDRVRERVRILCDIPPSSAEPEAKLLSDEAREGYRLQRWEMYPDAESVVPMMMLVPDNVAPQRPAPSVLCLPGSEAPAELLAGEPLPPGGREFRFTEENAMALHFVKRGVVALCVENPGTAAMSDARVGDWRRQSWELVWLGTSYEAVSVQQKRAALAWLKKQPLVDAGRIVACGHSLGAKPAMILGVLDPSLRAVVWNSPAYDWRLRHVATNLTPVAPWHYVPGFIRWFDYLDLAAALAPMPLMLSEGGRTDELQKVRQAYAIAGAEGDLRVEYVPRFREPSARTLDEVAMPEGLSGEEYLGYLNMARDEHYFKHDVVVPWVCDILQKA